MWTRSSKQCAKPAPTCTPNTKKPPAAASPSTSSNAERLLDFRLPTKFMVSGGDELTPRVNETLRELGCPKLPATTAADVELKLATYMRDRGKDDPAMRHITLIVNNLPCVGPLGCEELVPVVLPDGYTLTVHAPGYEKTFTGGGKPWWR
ncbi:DddA-like double-stranded DNA deaminase toxin [Actinokineospora sp.]|uniref:DddA-like double-stranded DNA deaminase toxin n=1 Tax=Actinokineospora sp. TaxID=1872133 RepID=UPI00403816D0